ncbi:MAG: FAD-dependent oxidoreductase, partial [Lacinutrix venerupis]
KNFFNSKFPDALALIPNIAEEFANNPTGALGTVKCSPWHYKNKNVILGDAAHAIVPFYGQGMNASFEDVTVFDAILEQHEGDWETIFKVYEKTRKADTDAIADLAIDNYYEMRDHVANPIFKEKRAIEMALEKEFPNKYFSKYSMVTFKEDIPYHTAMTKGRAQDKAILNLLVDNKITTTEDLNSILKKVQLETEAILEEDKIAGLK